MQTFWLVVIVERSVHISHTEKTHCKEMLRFEEISLLSAANLQLGLSFTETSHLDLFDEM